MNNRDYTGKTVFVGIDVHKKNYVVSSVWDKRLVKRWTMEASPAKLSEQLKKILLGQ